MSTPQSTAWSVPVKPRFTYRRLGATTLYAGDRLAEGAALLGPVLGLDTETRGTRGAARWQCKVVTLSDGVTTIVADPRDPAQAEVVRRVIDDAAELVVHNAQFDLPILTGAGMADVEAVEKVIDTLILSRAADPGRTSHALGDLAADLLGLPQGDPAMMYADAGVRSASAWYETVDINHGPYLAQAAADAAILLRLRNALTERAVALWMSNPYTGYGLDEAIAHAVLADYQTAARVMLRASCTGLDVDLDYVNDYADRVESVIAECQVTLHAAGVIDDETKPATPAQIATYLERAGLAGPNYPRTGGGALSTAKADLLAAGGVGNARDEDGLIPADADGDAVIVAYLVAKERRRVRDTYLAPLREFTHPVTGRIHPQVEMLGAARTGRMAAKNPAIQQWPAAARPAVSFRSVPGGCVSVDWSSIEPVIAMAVSGEHGPLAGFLNEGADLYVPTARAAGLIPENVDDATAHDHPGRKQAKVVLLGLLYGKGAKRLADELGVEVEEAAHIRDAILGALPRVGTWMDALRTGAESTGVAMTAAGRVVPVARDEKSGGYKGYLAQNYFHQGSASDVLTTTLVELHRRGLAGAVRMAVHDELIVDAGAANAVAEVMENHAATAVARFASLPHLPLRTESHALPDHWAKV